MTKHKKNLIGLTHGIRLRVFVWAYVWDEKGEAMNLLFRQIENQFITYSGNNGHRVICQMWCFILDQITKTEH